MQLIDTHTHLYLPDFDSDRDEMIERAACNGVSKMLMPNINKNSVAPMLSATTRYKGVCLPMIGLHPTSVKDDYNSALEDILALASLHKFIAVGEIGIDLYWDKTYLNEQKEALRKQLTFAIQSDLPVVIHSRDSFPEVFSVLEEFSGKKISGVFHAFSGTLEYALKAIDMGFMLGIGGPLTFKNSGLEHIVRETGPEHIVIETDSPYLAPVPFRGKRNESSYINIINKKLADIFSINEEETALITWRNSCDLFRIN